MSTIETTVVIDNGEPVSGTLTIETERIDVSSATKTHPDPNWELIDAAGHFHAWSTDKDHELPTLDARSEHVDCDMGHDYDDYECEGYDITVYSCKICGEIIEPATIVDRSPPREYVNGLTSWQVVVGAAVEYGRKVAVRVVASGSVWFGVAIAGNMRAEIGAGAAGMGVYRDAIYETTLIGASPLGRRKNAAIPVGS